MNPLDVAKLRPFPEGCPPLPDGWLNGLDAAVLYNCALRVAGPILEVGSWVGRSTCCIAYGLRDRPSGPDANSVGFDVVDFGIAGIDEWELRFRSNVFTHPSARELVNVICFPGGSAALLKCNLISRSLSKYVRGIFLGDLKDFASRSRYEFVFCDASHDMDEINRNLPLIAELLNSKDFILVCDDIIDEATALHVMRIVGAEEGSLSCTADRYSKLLVCTRGKYRGCI